MDSQKLLSIGAEFDLKKKPDWLDAFRRKYDRPFRYHVTLKTSTYFRSRDLESIKSEVLTITGKYPAMSIIFNKLFIGPSPKGMCIMIEAENNTKLTNFQKEISVAISKYGEHLTEQHKNFELNFRPHITIGRELTPAQFNTAKQELKEDLRCEATIEEVVLTTVDRDVFEEWSKASNKTHYWLSPER
jgi:2'-5' RNA ligase